MVVVVRNCRWRWWHQRSNIHVVVAGSHQFLEGLSEGEELEVPASLTSRQSSSSQSRTAPSSSSGCWPGPTSPGPPSHLHPIEVC